jgi:hypothetical protein
MYLDQVCLDAETASTSATYGNQIKSAFVNPVTPKFQTRSRVTRHTYLKPNSSSPRLVSIQLVLRPEIQREVLIWIPLAGADVIW